MFFGARQALHRVRQLCSWHFGYGRVLADGVSTFWCSASSTSCSATQSIAFLLWMRSCSICSDVFGDGTLRLWHLGYGHALADFASAFASMCPCLVALAGLPGKTDTRRNVANIRRFFAGRAPLMWCGFSARAKWMALFHIFLYGRHPKPHPKYTLN